VNPKILIVDDEPAVRYALRALLEEEGFAVDEAPDGQAGLERVEAGGVDLVLSDLRMPKLDGMGLLDAVVARPRAPKVILITAHGNERAAVEAMKRGAIDYFAKPFDNDEIVRVVRRALETARLTDENRRLRAELALARHMVFESEAMRRVAERVERAAGRDVTVLITGETGTGKELVARALVRASARADRPYVRFNCAALTDSLAEAELFGHKAGAFTGAAKARRGVFGEADGGTLLLDEVGELDLRIQGALLRTLQDGEIRAVGADRSERVDVRLVAATHRDLRAEVEAGRFRQDLYYRLNVVTIHLPPLRERPEDVAPLAEHFARGFGAQFGLADVRLAPRLLRRLEAMPWPGNVRELEHVVESLVALADGPVIDDVADLHEAADGAPALDLKARVARFEKRVVGDALARAGGNQSEAARQLGISRVTLIDKLNKYGLR
jgi:two-component system response regulator HydG